MTINSKSYYELFSRTKEEKLGKQTCAITCENGAISRTPCEANPFFVYPLFYNNKKKTFWTRFAFVEKRMPRRSLPEIHSMGVNEGTDQNSNFYAQHWKEFLRICLHLMCWTKCCCCCRSIKFAGTVANNAQATNLCRNTKISYFVSFLRFILLMSHNIHVGSYRIFDQLRFRRACASAQFRQSLRC